MRSDWLKLTLYRVFTFRRLKSSIKKYFGSAGGQFNVIHMASGLKADFHTANRDELHGWAFRNLRKYTIGDHVISSRPARIRDRSQTGIFSRGRVGKTFAGHSRDAECFRGNDQSRRPEFLDSAPIRGSAVETGE